MIGAGLAAIDDSRPTFPNLKQRGQPEQRPPLLLSERLNCRAACSHTKQRRILINPGAISRFVIRNPLINRFSYWLCMRTLIQDVLTFVSWLFRARVTYRLIEDIQEPRPSIGIGEGSL